jgi:hypothetical protein
LSIRIEGMNFTGFPGFDSNNLRRLSYRGRVRWLQYRIRLVFVEPFARLVNGERDAYVWLCVVNLLCSGVEALASFEFQGTGMDRFKSFVETYFKRTWRTTRLNLHDPMPGRQQAVRPAEHLYKFFRCGLAHSFCIEWGGLLHREDGAPKYLYEARTRPPGQNSLGVVPRELVKDFLRAVDRFIAGAAKAGPRSKLRASFNRRFEQVFLQKTHRPTP